MRPLLLVMLTVWSGVITAHAGAALAEPLILSVEGQVAWSTFEQTGDCAPSCQPPIWDFVAAGPFSATVFMDASLARAVSLARKAIDDTASPPTRIVTVARRGYRFQAHVQIDALPGTPADPVADYIGRKHVLARMRCSIDMAIAGAGAVS